MSERRLIPCPSCNRHVRAYERACPHCAAGLPEPPPALPPLRVPGRLSRAALVALGAGTTLAAACSSAVTTPIYGDPAGGSWEDSGSPPFLPAQTDAGDGGADEPDRSEPSLEDASLEDAGSDAPSGDGGDAES